MIGGEGGRFELKVRTRQVERGSSGNEALTEGRENEGAKGVAAGG